MPLSRRARASFPALAAMRAGRRLLIPPATLAFAFAVAFAGLLVSSTPSGGQRLDRKVMGWYTGAGITNYDALGRHAASGTNVEVAYYASNEFTEGLLTHAAGQNVQVLLQPNPEWIRKGDSQSLRRFVDRFRHFGSVYGWYLFDEPETESLPPARLSAAYNLIRQTDPFRPVAVAFHSGNCLLRQSPYANSFDILMFDRYPIRARSPEFAGLQGTASLVSNCLRTARENGKFGVIMVNQGFGKSPANGRSLWGHRDPTYREIRYLFWSSAMRPTLGSLFWADYVSDRSVQAKVDRVMREASKVPLANESFKPKSVKVGNQAISYAVASSGLLRFLIATNDSSVRVQARIRAPGRTIRHTFGPYQVHLWRLKTAWNAIR